MGGNTCSENTLGAKLVPWAEQKNEDKVETLRHELMEMRYLVNRIVELEAKIGLLENHAHTDGKVVIGIKEIRNQYNLPTGSRMNRLQ